MKILTSYFYQIRNFKPSNSMRGKMMNNQLSFLLCAISNVSFVLAWIMQSRRIKLSFRTMKILYLLLLTISVISYYVSYAFITDDTVLIRQRSLMILDTSNNGGNSNSTPSPKPSTPATTEAPKPSTTEAPKPSTTEAPTTQHQHVYDQVVVDTPEQRIDYPEQGYYAPAMQCHGCHEIFTSSEAYFSHPCGDDYGYSSTQVWVKTKDPYTEVIPAKTHRECKCGARE